jgi:hypothetical protein
VLILPGFHFAGLSVIADPSDEQRDRPLFYLQKKYFKGIVSQESVSIETICVQFRSARINFKLFNSCFKNI